MSQFKNEPSSSLSEFYYGLQFLPEKVIVCGWDLRRSILAGRETDRDSDVPIRDLDEIRSTLVSSLRRAIRSKLSWNDRHEVAVCALDGTILTAFSRDTAVLDDALGRMVDGLVLSSSDPVSTDAHAQTLQVLAETQQDNQVDHDGSDSEKGSDEIDGDQPFGMIARKLIGDQVLLEGECYQASTHVIHIILVTIGVTESIFNQFETQQRSAKESRIRQSVLHNPLVFVDIICVKANDSISQDELRSALLYSEKGDEEEEVLKYPYVLTICEGNGKRMASDAHRCATLAMSHPLQRPAQESIR